MPPAAPVDQILAYWPRKNRMCGGVWSLPVDHTLSRQMPVGWILVPLCGGQRTLQVVKQGNISNTSYVNLEQSENLWKGGNEEGSLGWVGGLNYFSHIFKPRNFRLEDTWPDIKLLFNYCTKISKGKDSKI